MSETTVEIDAPLYGLEAVYKACYTFLERAYVKLEGDPSGKVTVRLRSKPGVETAGALDGEFGNELLHQALRVKVAASNQKLREYIVARALASAEGVASGPPGGPATCPDSKVPEVLDEDLEKEIEKLLAEVEREGGEDPLKIAVPWQENQPEPAKGTKA